jgi:XTP/dITP diphosphohydrolase
MTTTLIFATNNAHKVQEIQAVLPNTFTVTSLKQAGIDITIEEPFNTLQENAFQKANTIFQLTQQHCFSEDTGLEVVSLNGAPGVKSARYAGEDQNYQKNNEKLLLAMQNKNNLIAQFRTVICLILEGKTYYFEGICEGFITLSPRGSQGFGYDPLFIPNGSKYTFAEMDILEKSKFSHRKKALDKMIAFLETYTFNHGTH